MSQAVSHSFRSVALVTVIAALLSGCGRAEFAFGIGQRAALSQDDAPGACLSFDSSFVGSDQFGLAGHIRYLEGSHPSYTKVDDVLKFGKDAGVELFLSELNIPEVKYTQGFIDARSAIPLSKSNGDLLTEWFAIDVRSDLLLSDSDSDGYYQFALLADDGAILNIDTTPTSDGMVLVDNDGLHSTRMGCGVQAIEMKRNETRSIRLRYYQGPRNRISLVLMWRKVSSPSEAIDVSCGKKGIDVFFNSATIPSTPRAAYNDLLARGWKPLSPRNFVLPDGVRSNLCVK